MEQRTWHFMYFHLFLCESISTKNNFHDKISSLLHWIKTRPLESNISLSMSSHLYCYLAYFALTNIRSSGAALKFLDTISWNHIYKQLLIWLQKVRFFLCKIKLINRLNALADSKAVFKAIHPVFNNQYI